MASLMFVVGSFKDVMFNVVSGLRFATLRM